MLADVHVHTNFSCDSETDMESYINKALDDNCSYLCFTDHVDFNKIDYGYGYYSSERFFREFTCIKNKFSSNGDLCILSGIEFSEPHLYKKELYDLEQLPYDYIIGSVHWVRDMFPCKEVKARYTAKEFYDWYWQEILKAVTAGGFDCLGHIDFPKRYFNEVCYDSSLLSTIFNTMIKNNIVLEINTSSIRKGVSETMPGEELLNIYKQCGGKFVTIGSDAHETEDLFAEYNTAQALIKNLGLVQVVFIKRKMKII